MSRQLILSALLMIGASAAYADVTIQENTTAFCGVDGTVDSDNAGFTGAGFANTNNATNAAVRYKVNVPTTGSYTMRWRYANGTTTDRPGSVRVNGNAVANVALAPTGAWTTWTNSANVIVNLNAGLNDVHLVATTAGGVANIDSFTVIGTNVSAGNCTVTSSCPLNHEGFATLAGGVTGGGNATPTIVTSQTDLRTCARDTVPRVCRVQGSLAFGTWEEIDVQSNKTIIGIGANAEIVNGGFRLVGNRSNVIIRNLTIRDSANDDQDRDGIQMDTAHHVWIDHNRFLRLGDGQIDSRLDTTYETVSWNVFEQHDKTFGIGWTTNVTAQITIHHNWIHDTNQRNPSADNILRAHLYNNVMENITSYGNYARGGTNMVLQNSVFRNVNDPHYYDTGTLVAQGNQYVSTTGQQESSGTSFSFFNPGSFYSYTLTPTAQVEALVKRCAGPRAELGL
jgi:pectate lyase